MTIALIGRGRLATNLLPALQQAGHDVTSVNSRTLEELPQQADVYIISVKDSALREVIAHATKGREDQFFVHTAGSMSVDVFEGYCSRYGVFYPMQTFSKERQVSFREIPIFIEAGGSGKAAVDGKIADHTTSADATAETLGVLRVLADSVSQKVYELSTADRKYLHLAAVFACNFANHCYALAADVLAKKGLPFDVMLPLIDETARKVHGMHPQDAQTGPAVRYDENVISMQSDLLADEPVLQDIYRLLSKSIHQKATEPHDPLRLTEDTSHRV
jgi:predicted short-subunit dehydrogenase-like oxidoreductase (DUF2520 family)